MLKKLLTKTLLVAAGLLGGMNAWAYEVPDGYEIKTVIIGTNNGDAVTAESFTSVTEVPTGWVAGDNIALSIGDVTEVTDLVVDNHGPSYVSGKCLGVGASGQDWDYKFATYSFDAVSSGYLVFNGDFYVDNNQSAYLRFADKDGNNVFSFFPKSGNNGQNFQYVIGSGSDASAGQQTKPRTYKGWRVRDMVFNMSTGALTFKLTFIKYTSGGTSEQTVNMAYNIGTGKNIAKLMIGSNTNNVKETKTAFLDNVSLFTVGVSTSATTYTVNAVSGGTTLQLLATGTASAGDEYSVYVPRVIEKNGEFYVWDEAGTATNYKKTYTMGSTSEVKEVGYTKNSNIVAYIEGETAAGTNESYSNGSAGAVSSANHIYSGRAFGTHPAGVYKFTVSVTGNYGRGIAVRNNTVDNSSNLYAQVRNEGTGKKEKTFILPEERTLIVNGHYTEGTKTNLSGDFDYAILEYVEALPATVSKTITDAGWATYCSPYNLDFSSSITNLTKAYTITGNIGATLTLTEITGTIPANTGILLEGAGAVAIPVATSSSFDVSSNKLVGVTAATSKDAGSIYVLMDESNGVGFYQNADDFTVGANTAYLPSNFNATSAGMRFFSFFSDDDATAINGIESEKAENGAIYNLAGQRVNAGYKGIVIKNGKKVLVK